MRNVSKGVAMPLIVSLIFQVGCAARSSESDALFHSAIAEHRFEIFAAASDAMEAARFAISAEGLAVSGDDSDQYRIEAVSPASPDARFVISIRAAGAQLTVEVSAEQQSVARPRAGAPNETLADLTSRISESIRRQLESL